MLPNPEINPLDEINTLFTTNKLPITISDTRKIDESSRINRR